jgi:hypothetical protein
MWLSTVGRELIGENAPCNKLKFTEIQDFGSFLLLQTGQMAPESAEGPDQTIKI